MLDDKTIKGVNVRARKFKLNARWRLLLSDLNLDITYLLKVAGLPQEIFTSNVETLEPLEFYKLWGAIEKLAKENCTPILLGRKVTTEFFSPAVLACLCSKDLENALKRLAQYEVLISPLTFDIKSSSNRVVATLGCDESAGIIPTGMILYKFVVVTEIARIATRNELSPVKITLKELPNELEEYIEYFSAPIIRSGENSIIFSHTDSSIAFLTEDKIMWQYLLNGLDADDNSYNANTDIVKCVRQKLIEILPSGLSSLDSVASELLMSKRTLQRKLKAEKVRFQEILNGVRLELAMHYLVNTDIMISEIAYLIGYLDNNAFHRAFKKWNGLTPYQYRNQNVGSSIVKR